MAVVRFFISDKYLVVKLTSFLIFSALVLIHQSNERKWDLKEMVFKLSNNLTYSK